ncbi:MAG: hypothetical protein HZC40_24650 [Chloroflexi bacterium]|nr:hypothetical protein [Chloroflexota bacterium]
MNIHRLAGWLGLILIAISASAIGCSTPTRESPWEPVPPTVAATLTSVAQRATATSTTTPMPTNPIVTPTGAAMPVNGITARLNETFTLGWSQWATLPDANNTRAFFTTLLEDTRCALDINCFQAGNVRVAVTIESGGKLARFDLSMRATDYRRVGAFNGYLIQFIDIAPARERAAVPIQPIDYRLKLIVTPGSLDVPQARVNEPFTLKLGQTISVADLDTQVTFEAVQQDSRCPARALCATSGEANVVIALQRGGKSERLTLGTSPAHAIKRSALFESADVGLNAITPYPQTEFASKEIAPGEYQITLVIMNFIAAPASTPSASRTSCPDLSRGDASEILGESLQDTTADLVLFQPVTSRITMRGLCGYGSVAFTPNKTRSLTLPSVSPAVAQSDYAVIAGKLTDNKRLEQLVSIASAIESANPRGDRVLSAKLLTLYSAGAWHRDLLTTFPDAARGATGVTVTRVENLGDSAIWAWREFSGGRYAALVAQRGDTLFVIVALANEHRAQDELRATMTRAMQKMMR